ncbi:uracil-DNA glycosylase family protein [Flexibacterium corallicola]|uniref:uracil-DNA glycosylase family protein n=1 Tax=Flexibacterium corallicola TaxID=3037259 RepID=UPI00286F3626|nr:uracil-DNA glycosylase family protein [Pseudovibrio sp. M1P-2-3]
MVPESKETREHIDETDVGCLKQQIARCRVCVDRPKRAPLPHTPRPVVVMSATARLRIAGQAPGTRVHASGRPFTDPSGDRLRDWLSMDKEVFYNSDLLAIVPMGLCFPGLDKHGGDKPPRPECRATWHDRIFSAMPQLETVIAIGQYAQAYHLGDLKGRSMRETVENWRFIWHVTGERFERGEGPRILPLPHPSWRNNAWLSRNPWFSEEVLPTLRVHVKKLIQES